MIDSTRIKLFLVAFAFLAVGCKEQKIPDFVHEMINSHEERDIRAILSFRFNGETVYYVQMGCCDMYNGLHDAQGNDICSPDGGFSGSGDGKCPTFWNKARRREVIWERGQEVPLD